MADFAKIAKEVFEVLNSFNYSVLLYDDQGMEVTEPSEARAMFDRKHNMMLFIIDEDDDSQVVLHLGNHTHAAQVMGLIQTLRTETTKYNVTFRVQEYNKDIEPKAFGQLASISEMRNRVNMEVLEGMYGTSLSSYLRLEHAKMIVRHKTRIDDSKAGARSRCIETILIENSAGERFKFPTNNLAAARAMTQHVNQGGGFGDPVGQQIGQMALEYANLVTANKHMSGMPLSEAVTAVREACQCKMGKMRKTFEQLYRPSTYAVEAADLAARANLLTEADTQIDEAQLTELRQLLRDCDDEVVECAARAVKENDTVLDEDAGSVAVLDDRRVSRSAWDDLDRGKLRMRSRPVFDKHHFRSAVSELIYRLGQIVPHVEDDSMANLLGYVADRLPEASNKSQLAMIGLKALKAARKVAVEPEVSEAPIADVGPTISPVGGYKVSATVWQDLKNRKIQLTGKPTFDKHPFTNPVGELIYRLGQIVPKVRDDGLANLLAFVADQLSEDKNKKPYVAIGMAALKAARQAEQSEGDEEHKLADKNDVIREFEAWVGRFATERVLVEYDDLSSPMHPYNPIHQNYDEAIDQAIADFDPEYFLADEDYGGADLIDNRDASNPHDNKLSKGDVIKALTGYLRHEVESSSGVVLDDDKAVHDMAMQVYDSVVTALQDRHFIVKDEVSEALTREDVLLPPKNQGDSLSREVSKTSVEDPDDQDRVEKPNAPYIQRLKTLAGLNGGVNSPGY